MGWIRANRRFGGALALLALVFQLVLSLSHAHVPDAAAGEVALAAHADTVAVHHDGPQAPAKPACDLCAILHMAGTGQVAAPPPLILPSTFAAVAPVDLVDLSLTPSRQVLPQSRAPPIV